MAADLDHQLSQLDELLRLLDANALKSAQESLENQIAELSERLEVTRQALVQAQSQRRRLARARLLLEESASEPSTNGDPALKSVPAPAEPVESVEEVVVPEPVPDPAEPSEAAFISAPFVAERRQGEDRRATTPDRRQAGDRRKGQRLPPAS